MCNAVKFTRIFYVAEITSNNFYLIFNLSKLLFLFNLPNLFFLAAIPLVFNGDIN